MNTATKIQESTTSTTSTTTEPNIISGGKMKKALWFSINDYTGTANDLRGCNNDSLNWTTLLKEQYGFETKRLVDSEVTREAFFNEINALFASVKSGDVIAIGYSGHGTSVIDNDKDELDGKDEAICLFNGLVLDDEIRTLFKKLPDGVRMTFVSDSCFSGTVSRAFLNIMNDNSFVSTPKYLPPKDDLIAIALMGVPSIRAFAAPEDGMNHILISGTDDASYSYDANINGQPTGAFSYYAIQILRETPQITYVDFYKKLRALLPSGRYPQNPQLEGSELNKNLMMFE
jgi:hypothetical protein